MDTQRKHCCKRHQCYRVLPCVFPSGIYCVTWCFRVSFKGQTATRPAPRRGTGRSMNWYLCRLKQRIDDLMRAEISLQKRIWEEEEHLFDTCTRLRQEAMEIATPLRDEPVRPPHLSADILQRSLTRHACMVLAAWRGTCTWRAGLPVPALRVIEDFVAEGLADNHWDHTIGTHADAVGGHSGPPIQRIGASELELRCFIKDTVDAVAEPRDDSNSVAIGLQVVALTVTRCQAVGFQCSSAHPCGQ